LACDELDVRTRSEGGSVFDWVIIATGRFWIGVPLFFVISGYCIAASANSIRNKSGGVGRYFTRRAKRIYPPLWAAIGLATIAMFALPSFAFPGTTAEGQTPFGSPADRSIWQWLGNLTLTESWRSEIGGPNRNYVMGQLWTLCYEEQFYLIVGFVLLVARRWFFPGVWLATGLVLFNLSSLNPCPIRMNGVFIDGLWIAFAAGVAVYYRLNYATSICGLGIEVVMLVLGFAALASDENLFDTRQTLLKYLGVACLFAVLLCRLYVYDAQLAESRWTAPLRFCGRMCYSLYLTHPLVAVPVAWMCFRAGLTTTTATVLVTLPLCTLLSVGVGQLFYRAVERRFLNSQAATRPKENQVLASVPCPA
jgi:peptidoglycan/LPS O-acetylase OafA/YrhL